MVISMLSIDFLDHRSFNRKFELVANKDYHFEGPISETCNISLTSDGFFDDEHPELFNYPDIIKFIKSRSGVFFGISEIIFTYYNIPIVRLNILGQEDEPRSLTMDLA